MSELPKNIGKYRIIEELGRGAMGTVYKAQDTVLDRLVALKVMSKGLDLEPEMKARFKREAQSAAQLQHPNIVTIHDLGEDDGTPYIAMELLGGCDLATAIDERLVPGLADKLKVVVQVCRGLDFAHKRGVIHRDVKPGNVQLLPDGTVKILDFGIAWREGSTLKTKTGLVMGTPTYMAPEQIAGPSTDHRADMWAAGVILYELLAGRRPFESPTIPGLIYAIVHAPPPPLDPRTSGLPDALLEVLNKALAKKPEDRFSDSGEMGRALQALLGAPAADLQIAGGDADYARHLEISRALLARGEPARALEAARRALALDPSQTEVKGLIANIESRLKLEADEPTLAVRPPALTSPPSIDRDLEAFGFSDPEKRVDEARLALMRGQRTEALRITEDVLAFDPGFRAALELRDILRTPAAPGRARSDGARTYTRSEIRLRRASSFRELVTFGEPLGIQVIALSPREHLVAAGGVDGGIRLWDLERRTKLVNLRSDMHKRAGHEGLVTSLAFSHDGALLASGHVDGVVHVWELDTGQEMQVRLSHDASVGALAFSPDGSVLASGGMDSNVKLWEMAALRGGEARRRLYRQPAGVSAVEYLREGAWLVTGHTNRILRLQDAATGRLLHTLRGHEGAPTFLAASPDGNLLASAGRDRTIRIFDLDSKAQVKVLREHAKAVTSLSFFPDGEQMASVAMDNALILWDLKTGASCATLWGASEECFASVAVLSQGREIACGLADGRIRIWAASD